jgi:Leucine-rich repeat (LRR) protein
MSPAALSTVTPAATAFASAESAAAATPPASAHASGSMPVPASIPAGAGGRASRFACALDGTTQACEAQTMARRLARVAGRTAPAADGHVPPAAGKRQQIAHKLGADLAARLGWNPADYAPMELAALGEQLIADHALNGDSAGGARLLIGVARAAGALDELAATAGHGELAERVSDFLKTEFKDEFAATHAAADLAAIRMPTRQGLARELLARIGLAPDRRMDTPQMIDPDNLLAGVDPMRAADYYFNYDRLSTDDVRAMAGRPLADAEVARKLAALPPSLDGEFSRRFDGYTRSGADKTLKLLDAQLSSIARGLGLALDDARLEIGTARLQYYRREVAVTRNSAFMYDGTTQKEVPAVGYIATIDAAGARHRYFLSMRNGVAHPMPIDMPAGEWMALHAGMVFGVDGSETAPGGISREGMRTRVEIDPAAQGRRGDLATWLAPALRDRFGKAREAARGQTPAEHSIDVALDLIPFRRAIVAVRDGDFAGAAVSGGIDVMTIAIPMLSSGLRLAAGAARGLAPLARLAGREIAAAGASAATALSEAGASAMNALPELRAGIETALKSVNATKAAAHELLPLDADAMAAALSQRHPRLARALARTAAQARGPGMVDGLWRVPTTPNRYATDTEIVIIDRITARTPSGDTMLLMPYGSDAARAYTRVDLDTGASKGPVLLADGEGRLYRSLPPDTLERYRIGAPDLLRELGARRPGGDGAIALNGKTYARIADDYVEIARDPLSSSARPLWRVVPPAGARRDIVTHRLSYDRDTALWRGADAPQLAGGGADTPRHAGETSRKRVGDPETPSAEDRPSSPKHAEPDAPPADTPPRPAALPALAPSEAQLDAFRQLLLGRIRGDASAQRVAAVGDLLARVQADPRGKAILNALQSQYELLGRAPDIVLLDGADPAALRPSLERPVRGDSWRLDLQALASGDTNATVSELAAVYNNMTGILQDADPYAELLRNGGPPLAPELEEAWARWLNDDKWFATLADAPEPFHHATRIALSRRRDAVASLRQQLRQARCHGGLDRETFKALLQGEIRDAIFGLRADLSGMDIMRIPPLPDDVRILNISKNPIRDWSGLPRSLAVLNAENTGGPGVLDHLPDTLKGLDISDNALHALPADKLPQGLLRLRAQGNRLTSIAGLPDGLQWLLLSDNELESLPPDLPLGLRMLDVSSNALTSLPADLPPRLEDLDLSENSLRDIADGILPPRLRTLDLSENADLARLPRLPATLETLLIDSIGVDELPEDLPQGLIELHAADNGLTRLPARLPPGLSVLALGDNALTELPGHILDLVSCDIYLEGNPISMENLPAPRAGQRGPTFYLSGAMPQGADHSATVAQAVQRWFDDPRSDSARRWEAVGRTLEGPTGEAEAAAQFRMFLDRLRGTICYRNEECRADVREWLAELAKPERRALLESTLEVCTGATERCDDRVALTLGELRKLRLHDDIRLGRYDNRPGDALDAMRQLFRMKTLQDIAYRKIGSLRRVDDVEVYMAYAVKLREPLALKMAVPDMLFFNLSGVTQADLDAALQETREAERLKFYKDLVVDDSWNALIERKMPERYAQAETRLHELADAPLQERIRAELSRRGLDPADPDAQRNIARQVWADMKYEILEPLTRDYLAAGGVPAPVGEDPR